jgi:prepilin-type N-terminal cleavage/methylation domain-containing protein
MRGRRQDCRGFSLVESLVALTIAAGAISAFYVAAGSGLSLKINAERSAEATAIGRDLIQSVGVETAFAAGAREGVAADGSTWRLVVTPLATVEVNGRPENAEGLYMLRAEVRPRGQRHPFVFETMRVDGALLR